MQTWQQGKQTFEVRLQMFEVSIYTFYKMRLSNVSFAAFSKRLNAGSNSRFETVLGASPFWSQNHNVVSVAEVETPEEPEEVGTMPGILVVPNLGILKLLESIPNMRKTEHPRHVAAFFAPMLRAWPRISSNKQRIM